MITISLNTVAEGTIEDFIVGILSSDLNFDGPITFTITSDPTGSGFAIVDNKLVVGDGDFINYEDFLTTFGEIQIEITASGGAVTDTNTVTVQIRDLIEDTTGDSTDQTLVGSDGDDLITGRGGNDSLDGGIGNDVLRGGSGDDVITDIGGNNLISGGLGNDFIQAFHSVAGETDTIFGREGNDYIFTDGTGTVVSGDDGNDYLAVLNGTATLGAGADSVAISLATNVTVTDFNVAEDMLDIEGLLSELQFAYDNISQPNWDGASNPFVTPVSGVGPYLKLEVSGEDMLFQVLHFVDVGGTPTAVYQTHATLTGAAAATFTESNFTPRIDPLGGTAGPFDIPGTTGDDTLYGSLGNDILKGDAGNDRIFGSWGDDTIDGGTGFDFDLSGGAGNDTITTGADGGAMRGDDGNDILTGGSGEDYVSGGQGNDTVDAGAGHDRLEEFNVRPEDADTIDMGAGDDLVVYVVDQSNPSAVHSADTILAGDGNDWIRSDSLALTVNAGAGNDTVEVYHGTVTLGAGADVVRLSMFHDATIMDFAAGEDIFDITLLLDNIATFPYANSYPNWDQVSNPFASGYLRIIQDTEPGFENDALVQVLRDIEDPNNPSNLIQEFVTAARLKNVDSTTITNNNFSPPWNPDGNPVLNYTPVALPDTVPYGGTDSITFAAITPESGGEMWRLGSDGSLVQVSNSGLEAIANAASPIMVGDKIYFNLVDPATGNHQIVFISETEGSRNVATHLNEAEGGIVVTSWTEFNGVLYFRATAAVTDPPSSFAAGIFKYSGDGLPVRITNETNGTDAQFFEVPRLLEGQLIYAAVTPSGDVELFKLGPDDIDPVQMTFNSNITGSPYANAQTVIYNDAAYFVAQSMITNDSQVYKLTIDGTLTPVTTFNAGHGGTFVDQFFVANDGLYYKTPFYTLAPDTPDPLNNGGLFRIDGPTGTNVTRITDDGDATDPQGFTAPGVINGVLYWGAFDAGGGGTFHVDPGTGNIVAQYEPGVGDTSQVIHIFDNFGFWNGNSAVDGSGDGQVYKFNPITGDDIPITHLNEGAGGVIVTAFFEIAGELYFHATERIPGSGFAAGIFKIDGTPTNTLGAIRITDETTPGTPTGFFIPFDTGAAPTYTEKDIVRIDVLANDVDKDGGTAADGFSISVGAINISDQPAGLTLGTGFAYVENNQIVFNPLGDFAALNSGQTATVSIQYTMQDSAGAQSTAEATITINGLASQNPTANPDILPYGGVDSVLFLGVTPESGFEFWRLGADGTLNQETNSNLSGVPGSAEPIQIGNTIYLNLFNPDTNTSQIAYETAGAGRGGFLQELNAANGGIIVTSWIEFNGTLYFHANAVPGAPGTFDSGIYRVNGTAIELVRSDSTGGADFIVPRVLGDSLIYGAIDPAEPAEVEIFKIGPDGTTVSQVTTSALTGSPYPNAETVIFNGAAYFVLAEPNGSLTEPTLDSQIYKLTSTGELTKVTTGNAGFGGTVVDQFFVTSSGLYFKTPFYDQGPDNGGLFRIEPNGTTVTRITDDGNPAHPQGFYLPVEIDGTVYFGAFAQPDVVGTFEIAAGATSAALAVQEALGASSEATIVFNGIQYWNGNSELDGSGVGQVYAFNPNGGPGGIATDEPVTNLNPLWSGITVDRFFVLNGELYFHVIENNTGDGFAGGIFKLNPAAPGGAGAVRITDESQPGVPSEFILLYDGGAAPSYTETDVVTVDVLANDTDADADSDAFKFTITTIGTPEVTSTSGASLGTGSVSITADNRLKFDPGADFVNLAAGETATVKINYTMSDGNGGTATSYAQITLNGVGAGGGNTPPTSTNDFITIDEDSAPVTLGLSDFGTYSDAQTPSLAAVKITSLPTEGSLQFKNGSDWVAVTADQEISAAEIGSGLLRFTPDANENGNAYATIGFKVGDGTVFSTSAYTLTVNVTPVNDAPTGSPTATLADGTEDQIYTVSAANLLQGFSDIDGGTLAVFGLSASGGGTVTDKGNGTYEVAMPGNFNGAVTLTYSVIDGQGGTLADQTRTFIVAPVNDAPSFTIADTTIEAGVDAGPQSVSAFASAISPGPNEATQSVTFSVTGNTNAGLFSTLPTIAPDGTLTYQAAAGASGTATITVQLSDDGGTANGGVNTSATQQFSIEIVANTPPTSSNDSITVSEDSGAVILTVSDFGAYADFENGPLAAVRITAHETDGILEHFNGSAWVAVSLNQEISAADINAGNLRYTPDSNENGTPYATIGFQVSDGTSFSVSTYTLTIDVTPVNDTPLAPAVNNVTTDEDSASTLVAIGASDIDGDSLSYSVKSGAGPAKGSVTFDGGSFKYTPTLNANGADSFTIVVSDGKGGSVEQNVSVTINPVNDAPLFTSPNTFNVSENTTSVGTITATDVEGSPIAFELSGADAALFSFNSGTKALSFIAAPDFETKLDAGGDGVYEVSISASDGTATTVQNISITVTDVAGLTKDGTTGNDTLTGTPEIDILSGLGGNDTISGLGDDDILDGGIGNDKLFGGDGNDELTGGVGIDDIKGDAGDDIIYIAGTDAQSDIIDGGANGSVGDTIEVTGITAVTLNNFNAATSGIENWKGNNKGLFGTTATNLFNLVALTAITDLGTISAGAGSDTIDGSNDNDTVDGGAGTDVIRTGKGDDTIIIVGAEGNGDTIDGGEGHDKISVSGSGDVTLASFDASVSSIEEWLGNGADLIGTTAANVFDLSGLLSVSGLAVINGGAGNDTITGSALEDTIDGGTGVDAIAGGEGNDIFFVDNAGDTVTELEFGGTDEVRSTVSYTLGSGSFIEILTLLGTAAINGTGNALNNTIVGNSAANILTGLAGDDILDGADGNDTLIGGEGADELKGGTGTNTASYAGSAAGVDVTIGGTAQGGDAEGDALFDIQNLIGSGQDDILTGDGAANRLDGADGNDTLEGGLGNDVLIGGAGTDILSYETLVGPSGVTLSLALTTAQNTGGAGTDTVSLFENLEGSAQNDVLTGSSAVNIIWGLAGDDTLNGGLLGDTLIGGLGNDTYVVDNAGDDVQELFDEGIDTVQSAITYTLGSDIENLTLTGSAIVNGTGNELGNRIQGNSAVNTLTGLAGDDTLIGGSGSDKLLGGEGNDTYEVDATGDVVTEIDGEGDADLVRTTVTRTLEENVENLTLLGTTALNGTGNALANIITGNSGANTLSGLDGTDTLLGGAGNDLLLGGLGNDTLDGEDGIDTASYINATGAGVTVNLGTGTGSAGEADGDTLINVENLIGSGLEDALTGDDLANRIDGGAGDDEVEGGLGNDVLIGGAGNDTLSYANAASGITVSLALTTAQATGGAGNDTISLFEKLRGSAHNDVLTGSTVANTIEGLDGDDTLNGGAGADTLIGGAGNDTYVVDSVLDTITEVDLLGDVDFVQSTVTYTIGDFIENLTLLGTGAISGTGNSGANVLTGNTGANTLNGLEDDDTLSGLAGNDILNGGDGNDRLIGGVGTDTLNGGSGDDVIVIQGTEAQGDIIDAGSLGEVSGDAIEVTGLGAVTLNGFNASTAGIEVWTGNGAGILGTTAANIFNLSGLTVSNLGTVNAGAGTDTIVGSDDDDTLNGGAGIDSVDGGAGNDTIIVVGAEGNGDTLLGGEGTDTLKAEGTLTLTLASFNATASSIEAWLGNGFGLTGTTAINNFDLSGLASVTNLGKISGGAGNDVIKGSNFADTIDGGTGVDSMTGGLGNDIYVVDSNLDQVIEGAGGGEDEVQTTVTYTLGAGQEIETLKLSGTGGIAGTGNELDNILLGNSGANILTGLAGEDTIDGGGGNDTISGGTENDILTGGAGNDLFIFHTGFGTDTIKDFAAGLAIGDRIQLKTSMFADFAAVQLAASVDIGDGWVHISKGADVLILENVITVETLNANDFTFVL